MVRVVCVRRRRRRFVLSRWLVLRRRSPRSAISGFGKVSSSSRRSTRACASRRASRQTSLRIIVIIGTRARIALRARRGANAGARLRRHPGQHDPSANARRPAAWRKSAASASIERRRRGAPLSRRQSDRPRQPVVRALHEHGAAAHRPSRHRLGHGAFVRELRPARLRAAGRRHRGDGRGAAAAMSASSPASTRRAIRS